MDPRGNAAGIALAAPQRIIYSPVTARASRVLIVATGPSLCLKTLERACSVPDLCILVVNCAIQITPRADYWFTLDPNVRVLPIMRHHRPKTEYWAAVPEDYGTVTARVSYHRLRPVRGMRWLRRVSGTGPLSSCYGLSEDPSAIHTGNSGYGALGFAYHLQPQRIAFLGLDGTEEPYRVVPGAPKTSMAHLPGLFASAMGQLRGRGLEVRNGSTHSRVTCFPRMEAAAALDWLVASISPFQFQRAILD